MRDFLIILFLLLSSVAQGQMNIGGEFHFIHQSETHPSGQRGVNAFEVGALILETEFNLENQNSFVMRYRGTQEEWDGISNQRPRPGSRFHLNFGTFESIGEISQVGLVGNPVNEWSRKNWGQDQMGFVGYSFADRYGYFSDSDWGLSYQKKLGNGQWSLRFVNGNNEGQAEDGYHKDLQLSSQVAWSERLTLAASLVYGNYDDFSKTLAIKERAWALLSYLIGDSTRVNVEAFLAKDPANEVSQQWAEAVDLTDFLGSRAYGEGISLQIIQGFGEKWQGFLRVDEVSPAQNLDKERKLLLTSIGGKKALQTQLSFLWAYEYLKIPQNYFQGARDQGRLVLGVSAVF